LSHVPLAPVCAGAASCADRPWHVLWLQDDVERQELRVETALAELSSRKHQDQHTTAAADASAGIDAFEMTLKRLGATRGSGAEGAHSTFHLRPDLPAALSVMFKILCSSPLC
jgi:hypothetical protein